MAMLGFVGVIWIETRVAGVTVRVVDPEMLPEVAVIVTDPRLMPLASPLEPDALLTDATVLSEDVQLTDAVRFCVELSV